MRAAADLRKRMQDIRSRTEPESLAGEPVASSYTPMEPYHFPEEPIFMVPTENQVHAIESGEQFDQVLDLVDTVSEPGMAPGEMLPNEPHQQSAQPQERPVRASTVPKRLVVAVGAVMVALGAGMYFFDKWKEEQPAPQAGLKKSAAAFSPTTSHKTASRPIDTIPDVIAPKDKVGLTTLQPAAELVVQGNEPKPLRKKTELSHEKPASASPVAIKRNRGKHHQQSFAHTVSAKKTESNAVTHIEEKTIASTPAQTEQVMPVQPTSPVSTGTLLQELKDARRL